MAFHQYNTFRYSTSQYNADANTLVVLCAESVSSTDTEIGVPNKRLPETVTMTEGRTMAQTRAFSDAVQSLDFVAKSITNKGFSEAVRINDWCSVQRQPNTGWTVVNPGAETWDEVSNTDPSTWSN